MSATPIYQISTACGVLTSPKQGKRLLIGFMT